MGVFLRYHFPSNLFTNFQLRRLVFQPLSKILQQFITQKDIWNLRKDKISLNFLLWGNFFASLLTTKQTQNIENVALKSRKKPENTLKGSQKLSYWTVFLILCYIAWIKGHAMPEKRAKMHFTHLSQGRNFVHMGPFREKVCTVWFFPFFQICLLLDQKLHFLRLFQKSFIFFQKDMKDVKNNFNSFCQVLVRVRN